MQNNHPKTMSPGVCAAALIAAVAGTALAQEFEPAARSSDLTGENENSGEYNTAAGLLNEVTGSVNATTGQNNVVAGNYHSVDGANITTSENSAFNVTHGYSNQAMGSVSWIGGQQNISTGLGTYLFGTWLTDNGLPGNVVFSDYDPRANRVDAATATAGTRSGPVVGHSFTAIFHGGHSLLVDDENRTNGLFVVPSDATLGNGRVGEDGPAFVGINTGLGEVQSGVADPNAGDPILRRGPNAALDVNGSLIARVNGLKPMGGSWGVLSDARLKKGVTGLQGALDRLLQLRPVTFEYSRPDGALMPAGRQTGLIAQEVEEVFPEWVAETASGYKAVTITGFEALAVQALRELRSEKDAQLAAKDEEIAELRRRLDRLDALEAKLSALATSLE